jgi:hypothetical protein
VLFTEVGSDTGEDIWKLDLLQRPRVPQAVVRSRFNERGATLSPDGRWLAYLSDESGRQELYVRSFPAATGRIPISKDGASEPRWLPSGRELFYRSGDRMMAVSIGPGPSASPGPPGVLFRGHYQLSDTGAGGYDVSPDGRFLMIQPTESGGSGSRVNVVVGWLDEVKARVRATP